jgi:acyl transferase domain-containing protein
LGHSVGEYVAACVAGVFSVEAGLKLMAERGRLVQALAPDGEMVAVFGSEARVARAIEPYGREVSLASINGPESVVISGQSKAVQAVVGGLKAEGVKSRRLQVSHAFHSPLMEPMLESFERVADEVGYSCPKIGMVSNVSGEWAGAEVARAEYWCRHARQPVRFAQGMRRLQERGYEVFVEVGPKPTLLGMGRTCLDGEGVSWLPSLRPGRSDWEQMLESLGELYVRGVRVDWRGFDRYYGRRRVVLPTYPFQRQRYWVEGKKSKEQALEASRPERVQSEIVKLVERGEAQELRAVLEKAGTFSGETKERLSEMVEVLIREHQREVGAVVLKDWLYEVEWQATPRGGESAVAAPSSGHWLILADGGGVGEAVAGQLEAGGQSCTLVVAGEVYEARAKGLWSVNPARPSDFARLFEEVAGSSALSGVLHLWSLDAEPAERLTLPSLERAQLLGCGSALHLVQALVKHKGPSAPPLWLVTRGAVRVGEQLAPVAVGQAPLWGLGKVVGLEHSEMRGGLIDLAPEGVEEEARALVAELWNSGGEDQIALREAGRYVARLVRSKPGEAAGVKLLAEGSYLITGGLGALGLRVARWLVEQGARHLVLVGRRGATPEAQAVVSGLEGGGARVMVVKADVSKCEDVARVLEEIKVSGAPLRGIIHAAGVLSDGILLQQQWDRFAQVMAPKVLGGWNLHTLTLDTPLEFFVCFSSLASLLGAPGQGNYAAANAFLDALAHQRRAQGLPGLSINWGPWGERGMAASLGNRHRARLAEMGVEAIAPVQGMHMLGHVLKLAKSEVCVLDINWSVFAQQLPAGIRSPLLSELVSETSARASGECAATQQPELPQRLREAVPSERHNLLTTYLQGEVAAVLGLAPSQLPDSREGFFDLGMDSLMAVALKNRLEKSLGLSLSVTSMFKYSTIEALGKYLYRDVLSLDTSSASRARSLDDQKGVATAPDEVEPHSEGELVDRSSRNVVARRVNREDARHLLAHLDQMSDDDVDALLASLSSEEENDASRAQPVERAKLVDEQRKRADSKL